MRCSERSLSLDSAAPKNLLRVTKNRTERRDASSEVLFPILSLKNLEGDGFLIIHGKGYHVTLNSQYCRGDHSSCMPRVTRRIIVESWFAHKLFTWLWKVSECLEVEVKLTT